MQPVAAIMLADLGSDGVAVRLVQRPRQKVGGKHRRVAAYFDPSIPLDKVARTLRTLADMLDAAV